MINATKLNLTIRFCRCRVIIGVAQKLRDTSLSRREQSLLGTEQIND